MSSKNIRRGAKKDTPWFSYGVPQFFAFVLFLVLTVLPLAPLYAADTETASSTATSSEVTGSILPTDTEAHLQPEIQTVPETVSNAPGGTEQTGENLSSTAVDQISGVSTQTPTTTQTIESINTATDEKQTPEVASASVASSTTTADTNSFSSATTTEGLNASSQNGTSSETHSQSSTTPSDTTAHGIGDTARNESVTVDETSTTTTVVQANPNTETATTSGTSTSTLDSVAVSTVHNDSDAFMFSKNQCVGVGSGSFYCSSSSSSPAIVAGTDRVFAAPDSMGIRQIYIEKAGTLTQISKVLMDNDAPYYDELSHTIVWHRLIDGRYQIISYDLTTGKEVQMTHDNFNNMQPTRYGDVTVWQAWVGNDWEIMFDEHGTPSMITDNTTQDVSPRINGNYIVWQAFENGAWRVKVYDRLSKQTDTIGNADGTSIDNPRFVLVYDTKQQNGDIETKGYDLKSGKVIPLSSTPKPAPEHLPNPDQTGEQRALVQSPVQIQSKQATTTSGAGGDGDIPPRDTGTSTATSSHDVVIAPFVPDATSTVATMVSATTSEQDSSSIPVLQIPPVPVITTLSSPSTTTIEDLIVTPFVEPIGTTTTDSQAPVASST